LTDNFDAVVIGAGIGGLNCGALLANQGMKVLVLEQHSKIGGYAHNFKRRGFTFESAIHSVPMGPNSLAMHILKVLGIDSQVETIELPSMYHFTTPTGEYTMPSARKDIIDHFAHIGCPASDIKAILDATNKFYDHICMPIFNYEKEYIAEDSKFTSLFHNHSYYEHITSLTSHKMTQTLLFGQWPYSGISSKESGALYSFIMFILHLNEGSHFCKGGFSTVAKALSDVITSRGGAVLTRKKVSQLVVDKNKVSHVITNDGSSFKANTVVSNVSPYMLHNELIPESNRGKLLARRLNNLNPSLSSVVVYLGMKPSFKSLMPHSVNFWFESDDFDSIYQKIMQNNIDPINHLIMLRGIDEGENPTLTLMHFLKEDYSTDWKTDKKIVAEKMLEKLEKLYPGIREMIDLIEFGSPTTLKRYTGNTNGALYGFANVKDIYGEAKMPIKTHLTNLFQTGHWGKPGGGIWNVLYNSYTASKIIMNSNL
jgi:prolycopene isomerase